MAKMPREPITKVTEVMTLRCLPPRVRHQKRNRAPNRRMMGRARCQYHSQLSRSMATRET